LQERNLYEWFIIDPKFFFYSFKLIDRQSHKYMCHIKVAILSLFDDRLQEYFFQCLLAHCNIENTDDKIVSDFFTIQQEKIFALETNISTPLVYFLYFKNKPLYLIYQYSPEVNPDW
jgi:hypothetical protein